MKSTPSKRGGKRGAEKPKETAKRLMALVMGTYKVRLSIVGILIILSSMAGVGASLFLQTLIDDYIMPMLLSQNEDFAPLLRAILVMAAILAGGALAAYVHSLMMATISQGILKQVRDRLFAHMQTLPLRYFDKNTHGDSMSRFTNDTDALRQMISQSVPQVFSALVTMISVFASMLYVNVYLTIFVTVYVIFMMYVTGKIGSRSGRYFFHQQASMGKLNGYVEEMMEGQKVVKVFGHEAEAKRKFDEVNEELCESATKANTFANILMPIMVNLGTLLYVLLAIIGGALAISGKAGLTLGAIAAFLQLSRSFTMPLGQISQQLNFIIMALAGAERIFKMMDEKSEDDGGKVTLTAVADDKGALKESTSRTGTWAWKVPQPDGSHVLQPFHGEVRFEGVDFGYDVDKQVLHDITLYAESGEKIAFVGATGAGKTTIANLINRFYDVGQGAILYDGIDVRDIAKADLRRSLGVVLQETQLFTGTIMENIRYGRLDATDDEVRAAARLANADSFIRATNEGYDTLLKGGGGELSQGQRQLLSIARAALADPPVLILDEATSNIDTRTERIVQRGMDALMEGRTVFVIAHRLSTIRNADVILVMEQGRIEERGNHERLVRQGGRYYQLYTGAVEMG